MWKIQVLKKEKNHTKTLFASNLVLAIPQHSSFSFIAKLRGHLRQVQQVKLVNKIDKDQTAKKFTHTQKARNFKNISIYL